MKDFALYPEMVALPVGEFLMGSEDEEGRYSDEGPQHRVSIDRRFAIGRYAVTFDEYDHFCAATERKKPEDKGWGRGRRPVFIVAVAGEYWFEVVDGAAEHLFDHTG